MIIAAGLWGIDQFDQSGFDQEAAYGYSYSLSSALDSMYEKGIQPVMEGLDTQLKTDIEQHSRELLVWSWTDASGEDCTAAVDTYLLNSDVEINHFVDFIHFHFVSIRMKTAAIRFVKRF